MAAVKKVDTVTLKDLAASLAETHSLPKAQANIMLRDTVPAAMKIAVNLITRTTVELSYADME